MKNHISFCVNNSKRLTFCFVNELQDVLRFLALTLAINPDQDDAYIYFISGVIVLRTSDLSLYP